MKLLTLNYEFPPIGGGAGQNPECRRSMAQATRQQAETMGWSEVAQAYLQLYQEILKESTK